MAEKKEAKNKTRCEKCQSGFGYLKIKDKTWQCRSCGHVNKEVVA
jgi:ribosomal protein L37AE/L43A